MINHIVYRQAAEIIAGEPVSIEPDGSVWADSDHRDIDEAAIQAEYERLVAEKDAARAASLTKLKALGLTVDDLAALGLTTAG